MSADGDKGRFRVDDAAAAVMTRLNRIDSDLTRLVNVVEMQTKVIMNLSERLARVEAERKNH